MPREGHLDAVYHLFAYLAMHHNARVVFDPTYHDVDMRAFIKTDWKPMYGDVKEAIPTNAPVTRGKEAKFIIRCLDFLSSCCHIVCVISLRGLKKGKRNHARARMSARRSLG
jgi:hypothetical protein